MTNDQKIKELERHLAELSEIYDCVQILASWLTPDGATACQKRGSGNFYARHGMAHEFIQQSISEDAAECIAKKLDPPDDWKIM